MTIEFITLTMMIGLLNLGMMFVVITCVRNSRDYLYNMSEFRHNLLKTELVALMNLRRDVRDIKEKLSESETEGGETHGET